VVVVVVAAVRHETLIEYDYRVRYSISSKTLLRFLSSFPHYDDLS
jgi:hypothetical protein